MRTIRKWRSGLLAALLVLPACVTVGDPGSDRACLYPPADVRAEVARLTTNAGTGSAVHIEGRWVTARHNVYAADSAEIEGRSIKRIRYPELPSSHPARGSRPAVVLADWSALSPAASGGLVWLRSPMIAGETVYVVGFPLTYPLVVTEGAAQPDLYSGLLVVTAPAMHGNSGGAVLACRDGEYRVAGIVTANALISSATQLLTLYGPQPAVIQTTVHYLVFAIPAAQIEPRVAGALVHRQLGGSAT